MGMDERSGADGAVRLRGYSLGCWHLLSHALSDAANPPRHHPRHAHTLPSAARHNLRRRCPYRCAGCWVSVWLAATRWVGGRIRYQETHAFVWGVGEGVG